MKLRNSLDSSLKDLLFWMKHVFLLLIFCKKLTNMELCSESRLRTGVVVAVLSKMNALQNISTVVMLSLSLLKAFIQRIFGKVKVPMKMKLNPQNFCWTHSQLNLKYALMLKRVKSKQTFGMLSVAKVNIAKLRSKH